MSWFRFNGTKSDDLGLIITQTPFRPSWAEETEEISIPGKVRKTIHHSGTYSNADFQISCVVSDNSYMHDIYQMLHGKGELIVSTAPDEVLDAEVYALTPTGVAMDMAELTVTFSLYPFARLYEEEATTSEDGSTSMTVTNNGTIYSEPTVIIKMPTSSTATTITLTVNNADFVITLPSNTYPITINCEDKIAYYTVSSSEIVSITSSTSGDFPTLDIGDNSISWAVDNGDSPEYVEIYPNQRWL